MSTNRFPFITGNTIYTSLIFNSLVLHFALRQADSKT